MNTKLITNLGLFGIMFGAMTSFGLITQQFEWVGWMLYLVIAVLLINRQKSDKKIMDGALAGFIFAALFYTMQTLLLSSYLQCHPEYEVEIIALSKDISPASFMIFSGMIVSALYAIAVGLCVLGWAKFVKKPTK